MKIKQRMWICLSPHKENPVISDMKMATGGWITLKKIEVEIECDLPSHIERRDMRVGVINKEIEKEMADHAITIERLLGDIQKLMAIES